jgi:hypothetical protein
MACYDVFTPAYCWEKLQEAISSYDEKSDMIKVKKVEEGDFDIEFHDNLLESLRENIEYWNDKYLDACSKANGGNGDRGRGYCLTVEDGR